MGDEARTAGMITWIKNNRAGKGQKAPPHRKVNDLYRNHSRNGGDDAEEAVVSGSGLEKIRISLRRRRYHDRRIGMFFSLVATIVIVSAIVIAIFLGFID